MYSNSSIQKTRFYELFEFEYSEKTPFSNIFEFEYSKFLGIRKHSNIRKNFESTTVLLSSGASL